MTNMMNSLKNKVIFKSWGFSIFVCIFSFCSCASNRQFSKAYYKDLAKASIKLGIDIDRKDNHKLYIVSSQWLNVPYKFGGQSKVGVDCSGLSSCIYKEVFDIVLSRSCAEQYQCDITKRIRKSKLTEGDLIFFKTSKSNKPTNHVGIYLKNGKFIHSSSSRGVRIDHIEDNYWKQHWVGAGRITQLK